MRVVFSCLWNCSRCKDDDFRADGREFQHKVTPFLGGVPSFHARFVFFSANRLYLAAAAAAAGYDPSRRWARWQCCNDETRAVAYLQKRVLALNRVNLSF